MPMPAASRFAVAALTVAVVGGTACVEISGALRYVERDEKRFTVSGKPDVSLSTFDGAIEIRPSDRQEVAVVIEKHGHNKDVVSRMDVRVEQAGNHIVVDVRMPKMSHFFGFGDSASAKLIVTVPGTANVDAHSGDGSIDAERIAGTIALHSGDGSINGRELGGSVTVHTGDGSIKLADVNGALDADTGDGSINASGRFTSVRARSGDGSITIHALSGSAASDGWSISTGDGSVVLEVPDGFGAELDAHTGDGSIAIQDVTLSNVTGKISRNSVRGRLGVGGSVVKVHTGDGTITLRNSR